MNVSDFKFKKNYFKVFFMGLMPAGLNMGQCGPRMEVIRQLHVVSFPNFTKDLNGLGVASEVHMRPYLY